MNITRFLVVVWLVWLKNFISNEVDHVNFDNHDIIVEYKKDNDSIILIEAFQSSSNERLINDDPEKAVAKLKWYSIGCPTLRNVSNEITPWLSSSTFMATPNGFYVLIDVLTNDQKSAFVDEIKSCYGYDVKMSQIKRLIPGKIECEIEVFCDEGTYYIRGAVSEFREFPMRVRFDAPLNSTKRKCLEMNLIENNEIEINCLFEKHSKLLRRLDTPLSVSLHQANMSDLVDEIFGERDWVYITHQQLEKLTWNVYHQLKIKEEYGLDQKQFFAGFIDDFVKQTTAEKGFSEVPFDDGLIYLTKFGIDDFDVFTTKQKFYSSLSVKTVVKIGQYIGSFITLNNQPDGQPGEVNTELVKISGFELLGGFKSLKYVEDSQSRWNDNHGHEIKVDATLDQLNAHTKDIIQWKIEGHEILPKSLNLCRLMKYNLEKELFFSKIKNTKFFKAESFKRNFTLRFHGNPKEVYEIIPNKLINISSITPLEIIEKIESLSLCFKTCNEQPRCHYVDLNTESSCVLYDKTAYFHMTSSPSLSSPRRQLFIKSRFVKKYIDGVKLGYYFKGPFKNNLSEKVCWEECLKTRECAAVTWSYKDKDCFMLKNGHFNATREPDFISVLHAEHFAAIQNQL